MQLNKKSFARRPRRRQRLYEFRHDPVHATEEDPIFYKAALPHLSRVLEAAFVRYSVLIATVFFLLKEIQKTLFF